MSRTRLLRRLERLMAQVEALESVIDTRGLEMLSDEQLSAWEFLLEEGGVGSRPHGEQVALWERVFSDPDYVASVLAEYEPASEPHPPSVPAASLDPEGTSPAEEPSSVPEVEEEPSVSDEIPEDEELPEERSPEASDPPRIRRSTDLPESKAEERARLFELETVRLAEPGDVPGSGFRRWLPPRPRRRRSRRF